MKYTILVSLVILVTMALFSCSAGPAGPAGAYSIAFRQGSLPSAAFSTAYDTFLYVNAPSSNYGTNTTGWVGDSVGAEHMALQFVINGWLPTGAQVVDAVLTVYCPGWGNPGSVVAYSFEQSWNEASSTWNSLGSGGTLSASPISDPVSVSATGYYDFRLAPGTVQEWVDGTGTSFGVVLRSTTESGSQPDVEFAAKENNIVADRPMLTVYYRLP